MEFYEIMTSRLLNYLCDPIDKSSLRLREATYNRNGEIIGGFLLSDSGRSYPIINGIPRFMTNDNSKASVKSFGEEWNYFNYDLFKTNWLNHVVKNTFGSVDAFKDKVIVDAGAGAGMQSLWMSEAGAEHVIALELSDSVDEVMKENLKNVQNIDIVQCSIDESPLKDNSIKGIVICHNVIQHTPSIEKTARALWRIVAPGGEFVFNCYGKNDKGIIRKIRFHFYLQVRKFLSKKVVFFRLWYARIMSLLRFVPLLGLILEKSSLMSRGEVFGGKGYLKRAYKTGVLNTFDSFGAHQYQHYKSDEEIKKLINGLQPDSEKILNVDKYFSRPAPIGCALRLFK